MSKIKDTTEDYLKFEVKIGALQFVEGKPEHIICDVYCESGDKVVLLLKSPVGVEHYVVEYEF